MTWTQSDLLDPLLAFTEGARSADGRPIPHLSTAIDIEIQDALATVRTTRVFKNAEDVSIEAVITFPVPVQACVFTLSATVGGRTLMGVAKSRAGARNTYEASVDNGLTAVLHEEVMRGVHTLSVAHLGPGCQIEVCYAYVLSMTVVGEVLTLKAPMTVGDVFGRSPLNDVDALKCDGPLQNATLTVSSTSEVRDQRGAIVSEPTEVPLNRPIVLTIAKPDSTAVRARMASGERLDLCFVPSAPSRSPLRMAILVDRSGSMTSSSASAAGLSNHEEAVVGLLSASKSMTAADSVQLWEFDNTVDLVFSGSGVDLAQACHKLRGPEGGTEIGKAIARVCSEPVSDILVMTDGQSYDLDVQALAACGRRITVVLVGRDSLEANIGHLAVLTDGDVFVAGAETLSALVAAAVNDVRTRSGGEIQKGEILRGGFRIKASPAGDPDQRDERPFARAAGAFIAACRISALSEHDAAELAQAEGLVTHLTSLVLVDEAGALQSGLPELRKMSLPAPPAFSAAAPAIAASPAPSSWSSDVAARSAGAAAPMTSARNNASSTSKPRAAPTPSPEVEDAAPDVRSSSLINLLKRLMRPAHPAVPNVVEPLQDPAAAVIKTGKQTAPIDWGRHGRKLVLGDLTGLPPAIRRALERRAQDPLVTAAAQRFDCSLQAMAIAFAAAEAALAGDRSAARVVRAILGFDARERLLALLGRVDA